MPKASAITADFANGGLSSAGIYEPRSGAINDAIIRIIREIYREDRVKTLARWISVSLKTAKNRLLGEREFTLDEVATLLASEHGYRVLTAIMEEASKRPGYRPPDWWDVCQPLMDLADQERMCALIRRRTQNAIRKREVAVDALENEIRRTQTVAIHGSAQAGKQLDALESVASTQGRVVGKRRVR